MSFAEIIEELRETRDPSAIGRVADDFLILAQMSVKGQREETIRRLRQMLHERHLNLKRAAVIALAKLGDETAVTNIRKFLDARNGMLRVDALTALGQLGDLESREEIARNLRDAKIYIRQAAAQSLVLLGGRDSVNHLAAALRNETEIRVRRELLEHLLSLGIDGGESTQALVALLAHSIREQDPQMRRRAIAHADAICRELSRKDVLAAMRLVPSRDRNKLAATLGTETVTLGPTLVDMISELRAEAPDPKVLEDFGRDLVAQVRKGLLRPAVHRDDLSEIIEMRLQRNRGPRSILLVGESGVGKTALIHALAEQLANAPVIVEPVLLEVSTGDVLSGTKFLGEWQTRLRTLIAEIKIPKRAIWYVPDITRLLDAGVTQDSRESFASMLSPYLERGDVTVIGEVTPERFRQGIDRDPTFRKHFQVIKVEEASLGLTVQIMNSVVDQYHQRCLSEFNRKLVVTEQTLERAADLAEQYYPSLKRPGDAIGLLETTIERFLEDAREYNSEDLCSTGPFGLPRRRRRTSERRMTTAPKGDLVINDSDIVHTLCERTGVPELMLNDDLFLDLTSVERSLSERILGQRDAVSVVKNLIGRVKTGVTDPQKPLATFFFVGPTGVGKTEMVKALAKFLFGSEDRLVRLDMGDYQEPDSHRRLIGDSRFGRESMSGTLTTPIREKPFSVILLDEIEKAHKGVFDLLLPVMAEGRLCDDEGRVTDFRRSILIMTSNIASDLSQDWQAGFGIEQKAVRSAYHAKIEAKMGEFFRPEFLARIDEVVVFRPLSLEIMRDIVRREVTRVLKRPGVLRRNVVVDLDDTVVGLLTSEGFSEQFGARPLKRRVEHFVLTPLSRALLHLKGDRSEPAVVRLSASNRRVVAEATSAFSDASNDRDQASSASTKVKVLDAEGRSKKMTLDEVEGRLDELWERLDDLENHLTTSGIADQRSELMEMQQDKDFWQKHAAAKLVASDIGFFDLLMKIPEKLSHQLNLVGDMLDRASRGGERRRILKQAAMRTIDLERRFEIEEYRTYCTDRKDRRDCYIFMRQLGDQQHNFDLTKRLANTYINWAKRKQMHCRPILESVEENGFLSEVVLLVEGPCAFGLLRGESGLHQFSSRLEGFRRVTDFIRVDVIPDPIETIKVNPDDIWEEIRTLKNVEGVLVKKPRTHVTLTHRPTRVTVEGASRHKAVKDAVHDVKPILEARLVAQKERGERLEIIETVEQARRQLEVVRKYQLSPQKFVRDIPSGLKIFDLDSVLGGRIDDFVSARVRKAPKTGAA